MSRQRYLPNRTLDIESRQEEALRKVALMLNGKSAVVGFVLGLAATASVAWALEVRLPQRTTARAALIVDELGQVLFGTTPGKVEVTNLPATQQVEVTNFPPAATNSSGEPWSVVTNGNVVLLVPADKKFLLTDISAVTPNFDGTLALSDSTGTRLVWDEFSPKRFSFTTGVLFGPGETVTYTFNGSPGGPLATFMGRLMPLS